MRFRETLTEFWHACGDRASWESGLTDVLAKKLVFIATETDLTNDERISFSGAIINYGHRKALLEMEASHEIERRIMKCRRCSVCRNSSHHWLPNTAFGDLNEENNEVEYVCKHCDAIGDECVNCFAEGCDDCDGEGVILISGGKPTDE